MQTFKEIDKRQNAYITWITDRHDGGLIPHHRYFAQAVLERYLPYMTAAEEKFATYFKQSYDKGMDISQMSYEQLHSWILELEDIILTAKASVQGASLAMRERKAKLSASEREKTHSSDDNFTGVSDAISSIERRKGRMTKLEKLKETYDKMVESGMMSREDADSIINGSIKVDESKQSTMTFNAAKKEMIDTAKLAQEALDNAKKETEEKPKTETEGFDFDALFKDKK